MKTCILLGADSAVGKELYRRFSNRVCFALLTTKKETVFENACVIRTGTTEHQLVQALIDIVTIGNKPLPYDLLINCLSIDYEFNLRRAMEEKVMFPLVTCAFVHKSITSIAKKQFNFFDRGEYINDFANDIEYFCSSDYIKKHCECISIGGTKKQLVDFFESQL